MYLVEGEQFLVALAEFDDARTWVEMGYGSLFAFLTRELKLSKSAAYYRQVAARLIQGFPEVVEPLRDGRLCITAVVELAKVITPENRREVLPRLYPTAPRNPLRIPSPRRRSFRNAQRPPTCACTRAILRPRGSPRRAGHRVKSWIR